MAGADEGYSLRIKFRDYDTKSLTYIGLIINPFRKKVKLIIFSEEDRNSLYVNVLVT